MSTETSIHQTDIELANDIVMFIGPPDSGKSNLVKYMLTLPAYQNHLVYDPLFGFDPEQHNVIRPPNRSTKYRRYEQGNPELNKAVDQFVLTKGDKPRPDYFIVDESGRILPMGQPEGSAMGDLNDFNAHYGIGVWVIGQRPTQINTDFENKATHVFVMGYSGKNNRQNLKDIHEDLPEALDWIKGQDPYGFVYAGPNNVLRCFRSVPEVGTKAGL